MKILAIGDLHGRKPVIKFRDFDAIIVVGDVCSDNDIAPLYRKWFRHLKKLEDDALNLEEFLESIGVKDKQIKQFERKSLIHGRKIMKYLNSLKKPIFMVPGNWDESYGESRIKDMNKNDYNYLKSFLDWYLGKRINPRLIRGLKNVRDCQFRLHKFGGVNIIGYGLSSGPENPVSKSKKRKFSKMQYAKLKKAYSKILTNLFKVYEKRDKKLPTIFISHNVPQGTSLDIITDKESYAYKKHLGSTVARTFCLRKKPLLCLGGHMHQHFKKTKLGKTVAINCGFGKKAQVLIDIDEVKGKIRKIEFAKR